MGTSGKLTSSAFRQRRVVARIDRVSEIFRLWPRPELADVLVGLDGLVPQLESVFGAFFAETPDIDVADHIVEVIELERPAWCIGQADRLQRFHELFLVAGVAA